MKIRKHTFVLILCFVILFMTSACGKDVDTTSSNETTINYSSFEQHCSDYVVEYSNIVLSKGVLSLDMKIDTDIVAYKPIGPFLLDGTENCVLITRTSFEPTGTGWHCTFDVPDDIDKLYLKAPSLEVDSVSDNPQNNWSLTLPELGVKNFDENGIFTDTIDELTLFRDNLAWFSVSSIAKNNENIVIDVLCENIPNYIPILSSFIIDDRAFEGVSISSYSTGRFEQASFIIPLPYSVLDTQGETKLVINQKSELFFSDAVTLLQEAM